MFVDNIHIHPEWFNGELLRLKSGTQAVADQMCHNYLLKLVVRREAMDLLSKFSLPKQVSSALVDLLHLPVDQLDLINRESKGICINDGCVTLLGSPQTRELLIEEKVALLNFISNNPQLNALHAVVLSMETCVFFPRFRVNQSKSIFTTTSYVRSKKRIDYYALLSDGVFLSINSIILVESNVMTRAFIIGQEMGAFIKHQYLPNPIDGVTVFSPLPGILTKLIGKSTTFITYDPNTILSKCVPTFNNSIVDDDCVVLTSIPNNFETD